LGQQLGNWKARMAESLRDKHIRDMGPELGAQYSALMKDVIELHEKWNQYLKLYKSPEIVELLNKVADHLFGVIQRSLGEDVLLNLARLTDKTQSCGKDNLTLQRLPALITDAALASEVRGLVEGACKACDAARNWRHRHLAHKGSRPFTSNFRNPALARGTP
jgi:hypothetical protein